MKKIFLVLALLVFAGCGSYIACSQCGLSIATAAEYERLHGDPNMPVCDVIDKHHATVCPSCEACVKAVLEKE